MGTTAKDGFLSLTPEQIMLGLVTAKPDLLEEDIFPLVFKHCCPEEFDLKGKWQAYSEKSEPCPYLTKDDTEGLESCYICWTTAPETLFDQIIKLVVIWKEKFSSNPHYYPNTVYVGKKEHELILADLGLTSSAQALRYKGLCVVPVCKDTYLELGHVGKAIPKESD